MKKIIIDTNIFVRLLAEDIPHQQKTAIKILKELEDGKNQGIISILVIAEFIIICTKFYKKPIDEVINYLLKLLSFKNIEIYEIDKKEIIQILNNSIKYGVDFADAYLLWISKKEGHNISTFDKKLQALA